MQWQSKARPPLQRAKRKDKRQKIKKKGKTNPMKSYKNNTNEHWKKPIKGKEMNKQRQDAQRKRKKKEKKGKPFN